MLYVPLDVNWVDHPKVMEVGLEGAGLHAMAMCIAKRMETDGVLHRTHLLRVGATHELIDQLIEVGLLDALDDRRIAIHGWLDRNRSQEEIANRRSATDAIRTAKSASGKEGNHRRWEHPGPVEECPVCNPPDGRTDGPESDPTDSEQTWSVAGASRNGSQNDSHSSASDSHSDRTLSLKSETESEGEEETETEGSDRDPCDAVGPTLTLVSLPPSPAATRRSKAGRIQALFEVWQEVTGHGRASLDDTRRKAIEKAMRWHPDDVLADAIRGWKYSPFHTGDNDTGTVYDRVGLILRDAEQVEKFAGYHREPKSRPHRQDRKLTGTESGGKFPTATL